MYAIHEKQELSAGVISFIVEAPMVARKCQAGQFIWTWRDLSAGLLKLKNTAR